MVSALQKVLSGLEDHVKRMLTSSLAALVLGGLAACYGGGQLGGPDDNGNGSGTTGADSGEPQGPLPFFPDPPNVYVAKVKNLLAGLGPTDDEIQKVTADPTQLGSLVDGWMQMPEYQTKMMRFFELAFQQTQIGESDFNNQLQPGQLQLDTNTSTQPLMVQNQQEVFARTMLSLASSNAPFNQSLSTQSYMMTTAMRIFYALTDVWQLNDNIQGITDSFANANPTLNITIESTTNIPLSQTLDPTDSAHYMHWYDPGYSASGCTTSTFPARANTLYDILLGSIPVNGSCKATKTSGQLTTNDFSNWTMVKIRKPGGGDRPSNFYDLNALRTDPASDLILNRPYIGFYTTPAFFANWQTNASNEMRVTLNQTMIVATGAQVDGTDTTTPTSTPGLDSAHATGVCVGCHQLLDPTRSIFASTFSWYYGTPQSDSNFASQPGKFIFEGVQQDVSTIYDFGNVLSNHPLVASAWAQKLCYYFDSEACVPDDPEFQRITQLFQSSGFSWNTLVKALVTSPITTHASTTTTATTNGEIVGVSRRDHICAALNARIGFQDICGQNAALPNEANKTALAIVPGLPSDGYGRGSVTPVLPNDPSLFYRAGLENFCEQIAPLVVDPKNPGAGIKTWSSTSPDAAIADFVAIVIGVPDADPRYDDLKNALSSHYTAALADVQDGGVKTTATEALQSTFIAACLAPSLDSMGM